MLRASRYRRSKYLLDWYYVYASVIRSWEHGVSYTEPAPWPQSVVFTICIGCFFSADSHRLTIQATHKVP